MVTHYDPTRPLHLRYQVDHNFLTPSSVRRSSPSGPASRLRWEFNSFEVIVRDGACYPIDFANATLDMAIISLHYYFLWPPGQVAAVLRGRRRCSARDGPLARGGRRPRPGLGGEACLPGLVDDYYEADRFAEFCATHLAHAEECMADYISSDQFDAHLAATIQRAFHEHEQFIAHYRGCWPPGSTTSSIG